MRTPTFLLLSSILLPLINAQQAADGVIVPFQSVLPACASLCGKLFDVQGACSPPAIQAVSDTCFCADPRLKPFLNSGTTGVADVCTSASCTDTASLQKIQNWYQQFCNEQVTTPSTTSSGSTPTGTNSGSTTSVATTPKTAENQTWFQSHWKWVVMVIVIIIAMIVIWVGAVLLKRRYNRKKEREIEMKPPVAWGPHQMQNSTSGYSYGDGIVDTSGGGRAKEAKTIGAVATPAGGKRESKGWLRKNKT